MTLPTAQSLPEYRLPKRRRCRPLRTVAVSSGLLVLSCAAPPRIRSAMPPEKTDDGAGAEGGLAGHSDGAPRASLPSLSGHNLLGNSTFDSPASLPWTALVLPPAAADTGVRDGAFCADISKPGEHRWDVQLRHRGLTLQKGHKYAVQYRVWASKAIRSYVKIGMSGPPYAEHWADEIDLVPEPRTSGATFTMKSDDDHTVEFAFQLGADLAGTALPVRACIDALVLDDPAYVAPPARAEEKNPPPRVVRVNQLGYLPALVKMATVPSESTEALDWVLLDGGGVRVASGKSAPFGHDQASGETLHLVDFSATKAIGKGYTLRVGRDESHPFAIESTLYRKLKYDALAFFYHSRSGVPIQMPYAMDPKWERSAGHLSDAKTPCAPDSGCDYSLDVSGGWYDAGDYGKYVVNGGVSVWTLLNQWERQSSTGHRTASFADGTMSIPERTNGRPDLLDEVRWELDWMLRMQVPSGQPLAGMAHHKMHDKEWTALGHAPADDPMPRFLQPPSTTATLNLAAVAAQGARVFRKLDPGFATRCLDAAERAWQAALANPSLLPTLKWTQGGGPYADSDASDEFYWAAAELFVTTGKDIYRNYVTESAYFRKALTAPDGDGSSFTWQRTFALGTLSLAVVPNHLSTADRKAVRDAVVKAADEYLEAQRHEGYGQPLSGTKPYHWGSNSFVLNNLLVMGLAGDITKDAKYARGVALGIDYLLGRNPLDQSYVTGYGARPVRHPHHRFWAPEANPKLPPPPPGVIAGGPNSVMQDGYVKAAGLDGCPPAKCYLDHLEAPSVNEVAINWNAPLAWVAAWLDERSGGSQ